MASIADWLGTLGLEQYSAVFAANGVDLDSLRLLTEKDLQELGVLLGHRKKLLEARGALDTWLAGKASALRPIESATVGGERRQIAVLFCDLVGSTALASRLDPEQLKGVLGRFTKAVSAAVSRYDGYVYQVLGDAVVAYFGYPVAHEAEADRAIRAGLSAIEVVNALDQRDMAALQVRVGISTGLVVVAHINAPDKQAVGETPNLAARLQGEAAPNSIVICDRTRHLAGGAFQYQDLGIRNLKGIAEPKHLWGVVGLSGAATRFEATARGALPPMVGRDEELNLLLDRWVLARKGEGQAVLISGEPGIGKSRAVRALREKLGDAVTITLQYQCSPYYTNSALYPILDHIERALKFDRDEPISSRLDKIEAMVTSNGRPLLDARLIGGALSLPVEERYGPLNWIPQRVKEETLRALIDLIEAVARKQPTLLLFEDVHWADLTTLELLDQALERFAKIPVLCVLTFRPEFTPTWTRFPHVSTVTLSRLSHAQSAAIVHRVAGGKPFPEELTEQIVSKTDGVPLFLEELTKAVLESGMVKEAGDRYIYARSVDLIALPSTLRDSLMARLDRLIPVKEIAQIGACIGREFGYELVAAVSPMSESELNHALDKLTASELIFRKGMPPNAVYTFKHALVQDAAYDSLLKSKRQELHAQVAQAIESLDPQKLDTEPEILAHHYTRAADLGNAIPLWKKAGELTLRRMALNEAIAHLTKGLELNASLPPGRERDSAELDLRCLLGSAQIALRGWAAEEVEDVMAPTLALVRSLQRSDVVFFVLFALWASSLTQGRLAESLRRGLETIEEGDRTADSDLRVNGLNLTSISHFWMGDLVAAKRDGARALSFDDVDTNRSQVALTNTDVRSGSGLYAANYLWMLGFPDQAVAVHQETLRHAKVIDHPFNTGFVVSFGACAYYFRGEPEAFLRCIHETEQIAEQHNLPYLEHVQAAEMRGLYFNLIGESAKALPHFEHGIQAWSGLGGWLTMPFWKSAYAEALGYVGEINRALAVLEEILEQIARPGWGERCHLAEVLRIKGFVLDRAGNPRGAEESYQASLSWAREQQAKSWELRTAVKLAHLWRTQNKHKDAYELLAPIYGWFTEGLDTADLVAARELLEMLLRNTR